MGGKIKASSFLLLLTCVWIKWDWQNINKKNLSSSFSWFYFCSWTKCIKNQPCDVIKWRRLEENWEIKPLKKISIIPHFYDVTWLIFETPCPVTLFLLIYKYHAPIIYRSKKLFIVPIKMTPYWPTIGQLQCILARH